MKLKIPFTNSTLYLGKKEVEAIKQSVTYGSWQNTFQQMLSGGGYRVSFETLYMLYNNVADIKAAIRRKQRAFCKEGFTLVSKSDPSKEAPPQIINQFSQLMDRKELSFDTITDFFVRDIDVAGNWYALKLKSQSGQFLGLQVIDPRTMVVVADKFGNVKEYIQRVNGHDALHFEPNEILHGVTDYSTDTPLLGCSPIEAIVWEGRTELASQMSNYYFYENNAVPAHLLIIDENLSVDQVKEMRVEIDRQFKGTTNRWKAGVIPFVKDVKTVSPSQKDMQLIETRQLTTKKIVVAFGVDSFLLGYTDGVQRSNAFVIQAEFYQNTIRPLEIYFERLVNTQLMEDWGFADYLFLAKPSSYEDKDAKLNTSRSDVMAGVMTINEARVLRGLSPLDNELADEPLFNGMLIDDLGQEIKELKNGIEKKMVLESKKLYNLLEQ